MSTYWRFLSHYQPDKHDDEPSARRLAKGRLRMLKAHKIRLHPTPEQALYIARAAGTARFTFNWARAEWQRQYEAGGKPSASALKNHFNAIRKEQFPWSYEVTKCAA